MAQLERTLSSIEVAEMVEKDHSKLMRDIRRYVEQFNEANIGSVDFFRKGIYKDAKGEIRPCYQITKKGCEFIAHKLTGTKGTIFTARYINRFHEMQYMISRQDIEYEIPWFIKKFRGMFIVLWRDFSEIVGVDIYKYKPRAWRDCMKGGVDFNGWGWKCDAKEFKKEYGFDYGEEPCMMYFYLSSAIKALKLFMDDKKIHISQSSYMEFTKGIETAHMLSQKEAEIKKNKIIVDSGRNRRDVPVHINIVLESNSRIV